MKRNCFSEQQTALTVFTVCLAQSRDNGRVIHSWIQSNKRRRVRDGNSRPLRSAVILLIYFFSMRFDSLVQGQIEQHFQRYRSGQSTGTVCLHIPGHLELYEIDFARGQQTNTVSGEVRAIRRK